jgi:hypothetical protein
MLNTGYPMMVHKYLVYPASRIKYPISVIAEVPTFGLLAELVVPKSFSERLKKGVSYANKANIWKDFHDD